MSSPNYVWELSRACLADADGLVVVLRVFMDESGTHGASPVVTVGAAWAKPSTWKRWTKEWNTAKRPINVHHSTDCHNRVGEYEGWSRPERDDYVKRILPVIAAHGIQGRIGGLHLASYEKAIAHRPEVAAVFGDPYRACFQWAVTDICEMARLTQHRRLAFIHENNDRQDGALRSFEHVRKKYPDLTLSISFGTKGQYVPLQCADTFAFEGNRRLRNLDAPVRKPMEVMDPRGDRIRFIDWGERRMFEFVTEMCRYYDERVIALPKYPSATLT